MSGKLLLFSLMAGIATADYFVLPFIDNEEIKLLNPDDSGYKVCAAANSYLNVCINEAGGQSALTTANPSALAACACCVGTTDIAPAFSTCSSYLSQEVPLMTTQISAYDYLYSACKAEPSICNGSGGFPSKTASASASSQSQTGLILTNGPSATFPMTSAPASTSFIKACSDMVGMFTSCAYNTPGFADMPFGDQASCYCCQTSKGHVTFTNQLDQYAASCRDWAKTGEPSTVYPVAKTFASFCAKFTDACDSSPTTAASSKAQSTAANQGVTTAPTSQHTTAAPTQPSSAVSNLRISYAAGAAVVFALVAFL